MGRLTAREAAARGGHGAVVAFVDGLQRRQVILLGQTVRAPAAAPAQAPAIQTIRYMAYIRNFAAAEAARAAAEARGARAEARADELAAAVGRLADGLQAGREAPRAVGSQAAAAGPVVGTSAVPTTNA